MGTRLTARDVIEGELKAPGLFIRDGSVSAFVDFLGGYHTACNAHGVIDDGPIWLHFHAWLGERLGVGSASSLERLCEILEVPPTIRSLEPWLTEFARLVPETVRRWDHDGSAFPDFVDLPAVAGSVSLVAYRPGGHTWLRLESAEGMWVSPWFVDPASWGPPDGR